MHYFFNRSRRSSASFSKRKDFSWEGRNKNPYIREDKKSPRFSLIIRTILLLSILALTSFLLLSHSYFRINEVLISGTQRINTADLESAVRGIMDEKKFLLLRRDNFFMVNVEEIKDILLRRFPIKELVLTKTFPNSMSLALEEKISHIRSFLQGAMERAFSDIVKGAKEKVEIIVSFLAILELARQKFVELDQKNPFEEIIIRKSHSNELGQNQ